MFWLSYVVIAIIIGGLFYAMQEEMYLVQVLLIQNLLIFIIVNLSAYSFPGIFPSVINDLAGRAYYLSEVSLLLSRAHTFLSMMFLHADIMHIFGNLLVLFFIGIALEDRVGKKWTFIFYFFTGFVATLGQYSFNWLQVLSNAAEWGILGVPNIGASGAVFGIMGALVYLFPRDKITMFIGPILMPNVRVDLAVGVFIMMQTGIVFLSPGATNVAHAAHFTGFAAGIIIAAYAKRRGVLQREKSPTRDYTKLEKLVHTEEQEEIYQRIIKADERDVKEAWAEHLIEKSKCPKCQNELKGEKCECSFDVWEN